MFEFIKGRKFKKYFLIFLFLCAVLIWIAVFDLPGEKLHVYFLDVGQGDSILIQTSKNQQILIDGGPDNAVLSELGEVMPFYDKKIELVILTHPHADHLAGLLEVLKSYQVDQILTTGIEYTTPEYIAWQKEIKDRNIPVKIAQAGQIIDLDKAKMEILYPLEFLQEKKIDNLNNSSIVCRLEYGKNSFLFTGDIEEEAEQKLKDDSLKSTVLKIPHHGSSTSLLLEFLGQIDPEVAVLCVGADNSFGHPTEDILDKLKNVEVYRTDQDGTIEIISDGEGYQITKQLNNN